MRRRRGQALQAETSRVPGQGRQPRPPSRGASPQGSGASLSQPPGARRGAYQGGQRCARTLKVGHLYVAQGRAADVGAP